MPTWRLGEVFPEEVTFELTTEMQVKVHGRNKKRHSKTFWYARSQDMLKNAKFLDSESIFTQLNNKYMKGACQEQMLETEPGQILTGSLMAH